MQWIRVLMALPLMTACGSRPISRAVASDAAVCVPSDTIALAGLRLDRLRNTPLYPALPATWRALVEPLHDATDLLAAYNGSDLVVIARGSFPSAPPGAVLLSPSLALAGSPAAVRAATAQRATGTPGAPALQASAELVAAAPIWLVVQGGRPLPLTGNLANLNRLLRLVDYAALSADFHAQVDIRANGLCRTADDARQLEEALRALVTLAAAGARDPDLAAVFRSAEVSRDGSRVRLALSASVPALEKLLR